MKNDSGRPLPTAAEYRVLGVLWEHGPRTVREVRDLLGEGSDVGYTTVLRVLQNLHDKGLVTRDTSKRSHIYAPACGREWATRGFISDLAERAFEGSAARLAIRALASQPATREELEEVRTLLERLEEEA